MDGKTFVEKIGKIPSHFYYAIVILLIALFFVGSYSYFRYKEMEIKKQERMDQTFNEIKKEQEKRTNDQLRALCFNEADAQYSRYLELNGTKKGKGINATYSMPQSQWEHVEKKRKEAKELCLKQYPIQ